MKLCPQCGGSNEDAVAFCAACGASLGDPAQPPQPQPPQPPQSVRTGPGMGWHKFLIYFSLWAVAVVNLLNSVAFMTGASYGEMKELVYATFGGLQALNVVYGLCLIAHAVLCVVTRFQLAGLKKLGPKLLMGVYAASLIISIGYNAVAGVILQVGAGVFLDTTTIFHLVTLAVMMAVNYIYYKKRADLFVN